MDGIPSVLEGLLRGPAWLRRRAEDPTVVAQVTSPIAPRDRITLSPEARDRHVEPVGEVDEK